MSKFPLTKEGWLHYTVSGLPNVYLKNGFKIKPSKRGESLRIHDVEGLHRAIALDIIKDTKNMTKEQFRFLRLEMGLSQAELAARMNSTEQNVSNWERGVVKGGVPGTAQTSIRGLYLSFVGLSNLFNITGEIAHMDKDYEQGDSYLEEHNGEWDIAA